MRTTMGARRERVVVAMSGGVDSSVAVAILRARGHDVVGMTLRFWNCEETASMGGCCGADGADTARIVAEQLGIPHYVVDARQPFERHVLRRAWGEYARGRTPSPCVHCNERIKFGLLAAKARTLGARWIATGHHARVENGAGGRSRSLRRGLDAAKDQSYFLFALRPEQIAMALMPIGRLRKTEVRRIAAELTLASAGRPESREACLPKDGGGFAEALRRRFGAPARCGAVVDRGGAILGRHDGVHRFTIGQRHGLGLSLGRPAYVVELRAERGEVVVDAAGGPPEARGLLASGVRWTRDGGAGIREADVQVRYRQAPVRARIDPVRDGCVRVRFARPVRAVAPGQAVVFYEGDVVLGGGWIDSTIEGDAS